jgi:channel protein (hemolysin III family)
MYYGEKFNAVTHLIEAVLSLAGAIVFVVPAAVLGDPWKVVSVTIYGVTLLLLYTLVIRIRSRQSCGDANILEVTDAGTDTARRSRLAADCRLFGH